MIFFQNFQIHSRLIVIPFHKTCRNNLHQITVSLIILRQQHQMIIPVFSVLHLFIKTGTRRHVDLTSEDRVDSGFLCRPIKIHTAIHHTVICNRRTVHPQFFHPGYIFFDLIGTVQQAVFRMHMQMCKSHRFSSYILYQIKRKSLAGTTPSRLSCIYSFPVFRASTFSQSLSDFSDRTSCVVHISTTSSSGYSSIRLCSSLLL